MLTVKQAAEKWGVTVRRVQDYCKNGRIAGVERFGSSWMIPESAPQPTDLRKKSNQALGEPQPLIRKTPFLDMTDLYTSPGSANEVAESLSDHPEAKLLFESEIAYSRGEIDKVYKNANTILKEHSGFYAVLSGGMLLGFCAMWKGDIELWQKAKKHICEAPAKDDKERDIISVSLAALDSSVYDVANFPEWFKTGIFEYMHFDALPAAVVFYAKYLYVKGIAVATKQHTLDGIHGISLLTMLPNTIEPMISWTVGEKLVIPEAYLRMICAKVYHNIGNNEQAIRHIDRAIELVLPDRLYGILVENHRALDTLLDKRIEVIAPEISGEVKRLHSELSVGWAKISGTVRNKYISTNLTVREREVAKLAAFGMSNTEIADMLNISLATVKQTIRLVFAKSGINSRDNLATIL